MPQQGQLHNYLTAAEVQSTYIHTYHGLHSFLHTRCWILREKSFGKTKKKTLAKKYCVWGTHRQIAWRMITPKRWNAHMRGWPTISPFGGLGGKYGGMRICSLPCRNNFFWFGSAVKQSWHGALSLGDLRVSLHCQERLVLVIGWVLAQTSSSFPSSSSSSSSKSMYNNTYICMYCTYVWTHWGFVAL